MKNYIDIERKIEIANNILALCSENDNGFTKINEVKVDIYTLVFAAKEYFGTKIPDEFDKVMKKYDKIKSDEDMMNNMPEDYTYLCLVIDQTIKMATENNSIEYSVARATNAITESLGKIATSIADKIDGIDVDNILSDVNIDELMSVINRLK
nr:MAG TPA: hypothetical protein [Caudoviricetes sp.]